MDNWKNVELGRLIVENKLSCAADTADFVMEGDGAVTFPHGRMRLESLRDPSEGQAANIVYWCQETFPDNIVIRWKFWPIRQPGLAIMFFSATGRNGEDLFDPTLNKRTGIYDQYHHGDLNAYHLSYFRKSFQSERRFQVCNLRKSYGFHLVAQGADPLPAVEYCDPPYQMQIVKVGSYIAFSIDELPILIYEDDGITYGPVLGAGKLGFRQMSPFIAEYADLQVYEAKLVDA